MIIDIRLTKTIEKGGQISLYQPRISDENIRRLYLLKVQRKKPMTHVLDEILNNYFEAQKKEEMEGQKKAQES
jgi:hypothetical protein